MIFKVKDGFILRKIGPQTMAVPVGARTGEVHGMIALTESGAMLWELLENGADKDMLVKALLEAYEVDAETVGADVDEFLHGLSEQGALMK